MTRCRNLRIQGRIRLFDRPGTPDFMEETEEEMWSRLGSTGLYEMEILDEFEEER